MIDVVEKLHAGRANLLDDVHAVVDMIPLISWMPLVGVGIVTGIKHLKTDIDTLLLCVTDDFLVALDTVLGTALGRNVLGVACEGNDVGTAEVGGIINCLTGSLNDHVMILGVVEALDEWWAIHGNGRDGTRKSVFL